MRQQSPKDANPVRLPHQPEPGWLLALIALAVVVISIGGVML